MQKNKIFSALLVSVLAILTASSSLTFYSQSVNAASSMPASGTANLNVVDISSWNDSVTSADDNIDFAALKNQVDAVYIRSFSHANSILSVDVQAVNFASCAQSVKLKYGFYYYYIPTADPADAKAQADIFYNFVKNYDYDLVPVLDVEDNTAALSKTDFAAAIKSFNDEFKALSGIDVMIYSYPWFMKGNFDPSFNWNAYKLWIANYGVDAPMADISSSWMPENIWCWSDWDMWQYTSTASLSSVPKSSGGYLDMSYATDNILLDAVTYTSHVQDIGWQDWVKNGATSGTSGQSKRLEAMQIKLENINGGIEYRTQVQDIGWMDWVSDGALTGTSGQAKRLEAIQIRLTGAAADQYDIYYRTHAQNTGWMGWAKNGESAGTAGYSYRLEAIEIKLVPKGGAAPGSTANTFQDYNTVPIVSYQTLIQKIGWQSTVVNGAVSGTVGQSKRLEAMKITLLHLNGSIQYRAHVQDIGWQDWVSDGALSGTSGLSKRMEAIQIQLTGEVADQYDVYYRVHAQNNGWLDWAKNGESAGTAGFGYRVEAMQVILVPKGGAAPGPTARAFVQA